MIRNYIEISRLFNMGFTGVAPVLGALSMWNISELSLPRLLILFTIGCLSHAYGFIMNDVVDIKLDKLSKELTTRPLVSGTITRKKATSFALCCMIASFLLSLVFYTELTRFIVLIAILFLAYVLATIYDSGSKKYPGMDIFVASAIVFLILFGASTVGTPTTLAWIVALIGGLQVLFMNLINGTIKDIDHDEKGMANTLAIRLGAKTEGGRVTLPLSFKITGYAIELIRISLIFVPFFFLALPLGLWQIPALFILIILTFFSIYKLYSIKIFDRDRIRKSIGITVIFMYTTAPIMLSSLNPYILLVAFIPPLWFISSNMLLHKTIFEPKTM
jgi:4-hydroxybenzoate polyprenyltransferase